LSNEIYKAINDDLLTVSNALSVTAYTTGLTCSFNGGCSYEVTADGLSNSIEQMPDENYITVCGIECEYDEDNSDDATTSCTIPALSTLYSDSTFSISEESNDLIGEVNFGTASDTDISVAFDGDLTVEFDSDTAECYIGTAFKEGHIGYLSTVKWFIGEISDKTILSGVTTFQGSDDDTTYVDLFTLDDNVHEGWNYYNWEDDS